MVNFLSIWEQWNRNRPRLKGVRPVGRQMQRCESPSGTGDDGLHAPFYNRPTTLLKSKVWFFSSNFAAARHCGTPMGHAAQIV
jgi:hypothetical protein